MTQTETPDRHSNKDIDPPRFINLCITARCNLFCAMCRSAELNVQEPAPQAVLDFLDRLSAWLPRPQAVHLTGGEPLLHSHIVEFTERLSGHGFTASLNTNGSLLTVDVLHRLVDAGLRIVNFSVDALGENHDRLRNGPGLFQGVMDIIQYASAHTDLLINVISVIHAQSAGDLPELVRMLAGNPRLNGVRFQAVIPTLAKPWSEEFFTQSPLWPQDDRSRELVQSTLASLMEMKREGLPIHTSLQQFELWKRYFRDPFNFFGHEPCPVGHLTLMVLPDGSVTLCDHCGILGTIDDDPQVLWSSEKADAMRREMSGCTRACVHRVNCFFLDDNKDQL